MKARKLSALISALYLVSIPARSAEIESTWLDVLNGFWGDAGNWSTPQAPNNTLTDTYNVIVNDAPGGNFFAITTDLPVTIGSLSIGSNVQLLVTAVNPLSIEGDVSGNQGDLITESGATISTYAGLQGIRHAGWGGILFNQGGLVNAPVACSNMRISCQTHRATWPS